MSIDLAPPPSRLTYTVEEAADLIGVGRSAAYAAVRAGEIPSVRVGRRLLVPKCALERMLGISDDERPEAA
jgi:excisionase family DNA binding protein